MTPESKRRGIFNRKRERNADMIALEVLCRVFDDGADRAMDEWRDWYDPTEWLHFSRALGAFIGMRLNRRKRRAKSVVGGASASPPREEK